MYDQGRCIYHKTRFTVAIDPMKGMITSYLASPKGREMIQDFLSSPEGQNTVCEFFATPQGRRTLQQILPRILDCMQFPPDVRASVIKSLTDLS
jgi:hypothetical protein